MPTYEYECGKCGKVFERFQSMTAKPVKKCPKCGGAVKRLIGKGAGIIFRGSGFYATDYKKKTETNACPLDKSGGGGCTSCPTNIK